MSRIPVAVARREWTERKRAYGRLAQFIGARSVLRTREVRWEHPSCIYYGSQTEFARDAAMVLK